jgi:UDP-N-acetylglucosamine transferase subunit ALG13
MIFVTVGTHEQPFDRLVKEIDRLKEKNIITERVFIQIGYSTYKPRCCRFAEFIKFNEMMKMIRRSEIVITHGGPGSIIPIISNGKIPIVVPRKKKYGEHVDDHQIYFCKKLEKEKEIIAVYETENLEYILKHYDK